MKIRNVLRVLRGIPLLLIMVLGLSIVLSCKNGHGSNSFAAAAAPFCNTVPYDSPGAPPVSN